jgi:hypothetical protein
MILKAQGRIVKATMQLDLWNAEARGTITTEKGSISWRSFVSNNPDVIITELTETGTEKHSGNSFRKFLNRRRRGFKWAPPLNTSLITEYQPNPPVRQEVIKGVETAQQSLEVGGGYTTAGKSPDRRQAALKPCI